MKTQEFIDYVESNGGININHLRQSHRADNSKQSFRSWFIGYLMYSEGLSRYVANRVASYYNV